MKVGVPNAEPPLVNPHQARAALFALEHRVKDAECIPWPALAESWRRDLEAFRVRLVARGWLPGQ